MQDLVELASRGDRDAFAALAAASVHRLFATARRILQDHDRAQDAVQSTLLGAWRDLPSLRDRSRFQPWLHRLLVRACYEEARKTRAFRVPVRVLPTEPAAPDLTGWLADRDQLERAFRRLSYAKSSSRFASCPEEPQSGKASGPRSASSAACASASSGGSHE